MPAHKAERVSLVVASVQPDCHSAVEYAPTHRLMFATVDHVGMCARAAQSALLACAKAHRLAINPAFIMLVMIVAVSLVVLIPVSAGLILSIIPVVVKKVGVVLIALCLVPSTFLL